MKSTVNETKQSAKRKEFGSLKMSLNIANEA